MKPKNIPINVAQKLNLRIKSRNDNNTNCIPENSTTSPSNDSHPIAFRQPSNEIVKNTNYLNRHSYMLATVNDRSEEDLLNSLHNSISNSTSMSNSAREATKEKNSNQKIVHSVVRSVGPSKE